MLIGVPIELATLIICRNSLVPGRDMHTSWTTAFLNAEIELIVAYVNWTSQVCLLAVAS